MEASITSFRERLRAPWIVGTDPAASLAAFDQAVETLSAKGGPVVIGLRDDPSFLWHTLAALALRRPCILATGSWPADMLRELRLPVDTVLGDIPWLSYQERQKKVSLPSGALLIATGGSGGRLRFARHDWKTLLVAVEGYRQFWQAECIDVVNVLPLHHVGGLVPAMRSFVTGGQVVLTVWKEVEAGTFPVLPSPNTHISLVPTQLTRLLASEAACEWLRGFGVVLIGGAMASAVLLEEAMTAGVRLNLAYGMTEALGTVAIQRTVFPPTKEAHRGASPWADVLPHWHVQVVKREVQLAGEALFKGYLPGETRTDDWHATGDIGSMTSDGRLVVFGRKDRIIITGGEKVNPILVEEALRSTGLCRDVAVFGVEDAEWGQRVVAVLEGEPIDATRLSASLRSKLPAFTIPKAYRFVEKLPRNSVGKLDVEVLQSLAGKA